MVDTQTRRMVPPRLSRCVANARQIVPGNFRLGHMLPAIKSGCYPRLSHKKNPRGNCRHQPSHLTRGGKLMKRCTKPFVRTRFLGLHLVRKLGLLLTLSLALLGLLSSPSLAQKKYD